MRAFYPTLHLVRADRNAIHYLADAARRCDEKSKAKYLALKARGCSHARALRTIGDRLLYVACTMLKNRTLFPPLGKPKMRLIIRGNLSGLCGELA